MKRPLQAAAWAACCIFLAVADPAVGNPASFGLIAQVRHLIHLYYVEPIDSIRVIDGAVDGMVAALPYGENVYISPTDMEQVGVEQPAARSRLDDRGQIELLGDLFFRLRDNFIEPIPIDTLAQGAVRGMLETLDPHSRYLAPEAHDTMAERYRGNFEGIGIYFDLRQGELLVIAPIFGSPSYGRLRAGDRIVAIDGVSTEGITSEQVMAKLRGAEGSSVALSVYREGSEDLLEFALMRRRIPIRSLSYAFVLRPGLGYIRIARFAETTGRELSQALKDLRSAGVDRLLLDLRDNGGGLLNQAVAVADHFLERGELVVYTEGRQADSRQEFRARKTLEQPALPLIIWINNGSASGSEIVAGAVQDLDRGLIVGQTSFGKGLVQQQYPLDNGGLLLLTIARYYTPLGRLIQRPYGADRQAYIQAVQATAVDSLQSQQAAYFTAQGRPVYGGGGITPDAPLPLESVSDFTQRLYAADALFNFARHWAGTSDAWPEDFDHFRTHYEVPDEILDNFRAFLAGQGIEPADELFDQHRAFLQRHLKASLALVLWGDSESYRILLEGNPQIDQIIALFDRAEALVQKAGR